MNSNDASYAGLVVAAQAEEFGLQISKTAASQGTTALDAGIKALQAGKKPNAGKHDVKVDPIAQPAAAPLPPKPLGTMRE